MATFSVLVLTAPPAGQGSEAGGPYVKIDGRECLLKSVELFLNRDNVKQIQIVFTPEALEEARQRFAPHLSFSGVKILTGGPRWIDQLASAKDKIADECTHVIVHDAARPAVPYTDIDAIMECAEKHGAAMLVAPLRSPLVEVDEGASPLAFHSISRFVQLLTPHVFSKARFIEIATSRSEPHASSVSLVKGSPLNVRAGGPGDATLLKAMLSLLPKPKLKPASSPFEEAQW